MPLYEYKCEKCGKHFDALQKFSDEPLKLHDDCGGVLERLVSPPAFHFKGTGWYVTDYKKSNGVSTPTSESSSKEEGSKKTESQGDGKSEGKTETKTETKGETKSDCTPAASPAPAKT